MSVFYWLIVPNIINEFMSSLKIRIKLVQQISVKAFHVFVRSEIVLMKMTYLVILTMN